jgi:hypothetical protein
MPTYEEDVEDVPQFEPEPDESGPEKKRRDPGSDARLALAANLLRQVNESIASVLTLLEGSEDPRAAHAIAELVKGRQELQGDVVRIVEGIYDGASMIGADGKAYPVPPNYASKSRLVEGDALKLAVKADGAFLFKQIGPVERKRLVGKLALDASTNSYLVLASGAPYKVLTASVTFFKGRPGDEAVILVPKGARCVWAAVENVIRK